MGVLKAYLVAGRCAHAHGGRRRGLRGHASLTEVDGMGARLRRRARAAAAEPEPPPVAKEETAEAAAVARGTSGAGK